jgi:methyl-accepting chemotaxis protein
MFKNLTIGARLASMLLIVLVSICVISGLSSYVLYDNLVRDRQEKTKSIVESARSIAETYYERAQSGEMPDDAARAQALKIIGGLRFGPAKKDYVWVNNFEGVFLAHPTRQGVSALDAKDAKGFAFMKAFIEAAQRGGHFVTYFWMRDEGKPAVKKISFVAPFPEWGWIIGTGIYVDDVMTIFLGNMLAVGGVYLGVILLLAIVGYFVQRSVAAPIRQMASVLEDVAAGNLDVTISAAGTGNEIGSMTRSFEHLRKSLVRGRELEAAHRAEQETKAPRAEKIAGLVREFESMMAAVSSLTSSAAELESKATTMLAAAQNTEDRSASVAGITQQTSANVQAVAGATEEMSVSSREIGSQMAQATTLGSRFPVSRQVASPGPGGFFEFVQPRRQIVIGGFQLRRHRVVGRAQPGVFGLQRRNFGIVARYP